MYQQQHLQYLIDQGIQFHRKVLLHQGISRFRQFHRQKQFYRQCQCAKQRRVFRSWEQVSRKRSIRRQQYTVAIQFYRQRQFGRAWNIWVRYSLIRQEKLRKQQLARQFRRLKVLHQYFEQFVDIDRWYCSRVVAQSFYKTQLLKFKYRHWRRWYQRNQLVRRQTKIFHEFQQQNAIYFWKYIYCRRKQQKQRNAVLVYRFQLRKHFVLWIHTVHMLHTFRHALYCYFSKLLRHCFYQWKAYRKHRLTQYQHQWKAKKMQQKFWWRRFRQQIYFQQHIRYGNHYTKGFYFKYWKQYMLLVYAYRLDERNRLFRQWKRHTQHMHKLRYCHHKRLKIAFRHFQASIKYHKHLVSMYKYGQRIYLYRLIRCWKSWTNHKRHRLHQHHLGHSYLRMKLFSRYWGQWLQYQYYSRLGRKAVLHFRKLHLPRHFQHWVQYLGYRQKKQAKQHRVDLYYQSLQLHHLFHHWNQWMEIKMEKRTRHQHILEYYDDRLVVRCFSEWHHVIAQLLDIQQASHDMTLFYLENGLQRWRWNLLMIRQERQAREFRLHRKYFNAWIEYCQLLRFKVNLKYKITTFHCFSAIRQWKQWYTIQLQIKQALLHYEQVLTENVFLKFVQGCRLQQQHLELISFIHHVQELKWLKKCLKAWQLYVVGRFTKHLFRIKSERFYQHQLIEHWYQLARESRYYWFYYQKQCLKIFYSWRHWYQLERLRPMLEKWKQYYVQQQIQHQKYRQVQLFYYQHMIRSHFHQWYEYVYRPILQVYQFRNRKVLWMRFQQWQRFTRQCRRIRQLRKWRALFYWKRFRQHQQIRRLFYQHQVTFLHHYFMQWTERTYLMQTLHWWKWKCHWNRAVRWHRIRTWQRCMLQWQWMVRYQQLERQLRGKIERKTKSWTFWYWKQQQTLSIRIFEHYSWSLKSKWFHRWRQNYRSCQLYLKVQLHLKVRRWHSTTVRQKQDRFRYQEALHFRLQQLLHRWKHYREQCQKQNQAQLFFQKRILYPNIWQKWRQYHRNQRYSAQQFQRSVQWHEHNLFRRYWHLWRIGIEMQNQWRTIEQYFLHRRQLHSFLKWKQYHHHRITKQELYHQIHGHYQYQLTKSVYQQLVQFVNVKQDLQWRVDRFIEWNLQQHLRKWKYWLQRRNTYRQWNGFFHWKRYWIHQHAIPCMLQVKQRLAIRRWERTAVKQWIQRELQCIGIAQYHFQLKRSILKVWLVRLQRRKHNQRNRQQHLRRVQFVFDQWKKAYRTAAHYRFWILQKHWRKWINRILSIFATS